MDAFIQKELSSSFSFTKKKEYNIIKIYKGSVEMKYYCLGIKGTGMSTLAQILYDLGNEVSGYDDATGHKFTQVGLEERNIPIYYDQSKNVYDFILKLK